MPALSLGERVSRDGAFTSRRATGEGSLPDFDTMSVIPHRCLAAKRAVVPKAPWSAAAKLPPFHLGFKAAASLPHSKALRA